MRPMHAILAGIPVLAIGWQGAAPGADLPVVHSQPSYIFNSADVEVAVTRVGGQMAPVTFFRNSGKAVQPYYISPWQDEPASPLPAPVMVPLRGDFFCLPFGGNTEEVAGEKHPPHGETAGSIWKMMGVKKSGPVTTMTLKMETTVRKGTVTNELSLIDGHNVVYSRHTIEGFAGKMPLGHHATLAMPDKEGAVRIATSPIRFGMTCPGVFSDPRQGEYQALLPGAKWHDLAQVPVAWKDAPDADLTRLPGRYGFADLVQVVNEPWKPSTGPTWTAATYPDAGYIWFSLKDPAVLATTVFWMENHGRHAKPWSGRNNCLGLEDVTSHFADGLAASTRENVLTQEGVPTAIELRADKPTVVNYIQGVVRIPVGFETVGKLEFAPGEVTFVSPAGQRVTAPVRHEFLKSGTLE